MFGHPALRRLLVLKLRGGVRAQLRKLRQPSGIVFMLLGLLMLAFWLSSIVLTSFLARSHSEVASATGRAGVQLGLVVMLVLTVVGAFSHRGLMLPKEEVELAFSAPVSRSDLVRYRLLVNLLRSLPSGLVFGALAALRMPRPEFAFAGAFVTLATLPVLGQAAAILLGSAENGFARAVQKLPLRAITIVFVLLLVAGMGLVLAGGTLFDGETLPHTTKPAELLEAVTNLPVVREALLILTPWVEVVSAPDAATFWPWFAVCVVIWFAGYELTARIPVDFRELSLATAADVAKRLNRIRRGGVGASSGDVDRRALAWRVPWCFGRGPFGAIAWLKLGQIVRKARGTLLTSVFVIAIVSVVFVRIGGSDPLEHAGSALALALLGTLYLCMVLRFDFRTDLDLLPLVKTWPAAPWRIFLATILPEVALVTALLWTAVLVRAFVTGGVVPEIALVFVLQPLFALTWVAIDNAVFLFSPLRYAPGQEGGLQHIGRSVLLLFLRGGAFVAIGTVAAVPIVAWVFFADRALDAGVRAIVAGAAVILALVLACADVVLVATGGWMLRRFDAARDRA